jgi:hypothetical protein
MKAGAFLFCLRDYSLAIQSGTPGGGLATFEFSVCAKMTNRERSKPFAQIHAAVPPNSSLTLRDCCVAGRCFFERYSCAKFESCESAGSARASGPGDAGAATGEME